MVNESSPTERQYLVMSDLHLGDGGTLEDFVHDETFHRLVTNKALEAAQKGVQLELILAGDIIDFLQVRPLGVHDATVSEDKLRAVFKAHPRFFEALTELVSSNHRITFLKGNHDLDLIFPNVWEALVSHIRRGKPVAPNAVQLLLGYLLPGVYLEHGHQYDIKNRIDYDDPAQGIDGHLLLPWGSLFVNSVFNDIEEKYPFIDKVKGYTAAALLLAVLDTSLTWERIRRFVQMNAAHMQASSMNDFVNTLLLIAAGPRPTSNVTGAKGPKFDETAMNDFLWELGHAYSEIELIRRLESARETPGAKGGSADLMLTAQHKLYTLARRSSEAEDNLGQKDSLVKIANTLAEQHKASFVIMGHTHGARNIDLICGAKYINTGTWLPRLVMPVFSTDQDFSAWLQTMRSAPPNYVRNTNGNYATIHFHNGQPDVALHPLLLS